MGLPILFFPSVRSVGLYTQRKKNVWDQLRMHLETGCYIKKRATTRVAPTEKLITKETKSVTPPYPQGGVLSLYLILRSPEHYPKNHQDQGKIH